MCLKKHSLRYAEDFMIAKTAWITRYSDNDERDFIANRKSNLGIAKRLIYG